MFGCWLFSAMHASLVTHHLFSLNTSSLLVEIVVHCRFIYDSFLISMELLEYDDTVQLVVIRAPLLNSTLLCDKLSKAMGHNSYGEPAWPNDILYIFPVVMLGIESLMFNLLRILSDKCVGIVSMLSFPASFLTAPLLENLNRYQNPLRRPIGLLNYILVIIYYH